MADSSPIDGGYRRRWPSPKGRGAASPAPVWRGGVAALCVPGAAGRVGARGRRGHRTCRPDAAADAPEEVMPRGHDLATQGHLYRSIERALPAWLTSWA